MLRPLLLSMLALGAPGIALLPAQAAPAAITLQAIDAGPAVPMSPYISYLIAGVDQPGVMEGWKFPIKTGLVPGRLKQAGVRALDARWLTQPVFLLGSDEASLDWLRRHAAALRRMDAAGIVMAAADVRAFKRVQRLASEQMLPVAPGPDAWLEAQLIKARAGVLPVLIQTDGRVTQEFQEPRP